MKRIAAKATKRAGSEAQAKQNAKRRQKKAIRELGARRERIGFVQKIKTAKPARELSSTRAKGSMSLGRQLRRATQAGDTKKAAIIREKISNRLVKKGLATRNEKGAAVLNRVRKLKSG